MVHGSNVAIVTGSGRGIGAAIAKGLAEDGYAVAVNYIRNEAAASQVVSEITSAGGIAFAIQADISKDADVVRLFAAVDRNFGTLTALINNGGVTGKFGRVEELSAATLESVFSVNVIGAFLCCREAVRRMSTRNGGSGGNIVNISSRAAQIGGAGEWVHYAATKGALDTLTIGLRARLLRRAFASTRLRRALSTRSYMLRQEYRTGCNDWLRPSPWAAPGRQTKLQAVSAFCFPRRQPMSRRQFFQFREVVDAPPAAVLPAIHAVSHFLSAAQQQDRHSDDPSGCGKIFPPWGPLGMVP